MQSLTEGQQSLNIPGATVRQIINNLEEVCPGIKDRLVDNNRINSSISVAIDGVVSPMGMLEKVNEDSEVHFLPAIGGG